VPRPIKLTVFKRPHFKRPRKVIIGVGARGKFDKDKWEV